MCRILVADSHEIVRLGLRSLLAPLPGVVICGDSGDGRDAIQKIQNTKPDVIVASLALPGANGLIVANYSWKAHPGRKLLILGNVSSGETLRSLLRARVNGLVSKSDPASDIVNAVEALRRNRPYFSRNLDAFILREYLHPKATAARAEGDRCLTLREYEVLQALAEGRSTKDAAVNLGLSVKTLETHRSNLMRKLELHSVVELTRYAIAHDVIEVPVLSPDSSVMGVSDSAAIRDNCSSQRTLEAESARQLGVVPTTSTPLAMGA